MKHTQRQRQSRVGVRYQTEVPNEIYLIAMILDPRIKSFSFVNEPDCMQQQIQAEVLLKVLYTQLKQNITNSENNKMCIETRMSLKNDNKDIFSKM
ncbi:4346_t:CDS:2 [Dentiscutata erythropus]|uniref:4346_t:CDS:1 n=1 Tax=Dentiscutata erythropus TaxID=1348616 RepID=A0A9N9EP38_9GLOM|nr:4346_t:CDS:2 [Dentiscutata erythropus]